MANFLYNIEIFLQLLLQDMSSQCFKKPLRIRSGGLRCNRRFRHLRIIGLGMFMIYHRIKRHSNASGFLKLNIILMAQWSVTKLD